MIGNFPGPGERIVVSFFAPRTRRSENNLIQMECSTEPECDSNLENAPTKRCVRPGLRWRRQFQLLALSPVGVWCSCLLTSSDEELCSSEANVL